MNQTIELSHQEKINLYNQCSKESLIEMLIESNNIIGKLVPKPLVTSFDYQKISNDFYQINELLKKHGDTDDQLIVQKRNNKIEKIEKIEAELTDLMNQMLQSFNQDGSLISLKYDEKTETCDVKLNVHIVEEDNHIGFGVY